MATEYKNGAPLVESEVVLLGDLTKEWPTDEVRQLEQSERERPGGDQIYGLASSQFLDFQCLAGQGTGVTPSGRLQF